MIRPRTSTLLLLLASAAVGCAVEPDPPPEVDDDDDDAIDDAAYSGPAYRPCVTEAQCDPGSACTVIPGYGGRFCSPACDPFGLGDECALEGLPFDVMCLDTARCARHCADGEEPILPDDDPPDDPRTEDDPRCPAEMTCRDVDESNLCAGLVAGIAGYYGLCSHPNVDGPDCPPASSCFGGQLVGSDSGICLPWCDDGTCPDAVGAQNATPLCYDLSGKVDIDHPICALLCTPGDETSICPNGQVCLDIGFGGFGLCSPPDATSPFL
jgi:hypothetical protein